MKRRDARRLFELKHDICVLPACGEYEGNPIFRASFDGLTPDDEPVEIKCPSDTVLDEVRRLGLKNHACRHYAVQVQHQILVAGAKRGWLVFYDRDRIIEFDLKRDDELIARILEEGQKFHRLMVEGQLPDTDPKKDFYVPEAGNAEAWVHAAQRYAGLESQIAALETRLAALKSQQLKVRDELTAQMGDYDKADFGGIALTRSMTRGKADLFAVFKDATGREPTTEEIDRRRGPASERWLVRLTKQFAPENCLEPATVEAARAIEPEIDWRI